MGSTNDATLAPLHPSSIRGQRRQLEARRIQWFLRIDQLSMSSPDLKP